MNDTLLWMFRSFSAAMAAVLVLVYSAAAWAQDVPGLETEDPGGRSYTMQYVLVFLLSAMAVAAACKPSFRHGHEES